MLKTDIADFKIRKILNLNINSVSYQDSLESISTIIKQKKHIKIAFANANTVLLFRDKTKSNLITDNFFVLPDGIGVDVASYILYGSKFIENLNGTDFVPRFLAHQSVPLKVVLLGGEPDIAERAASALRAMAPQHDIRVLFHGFFDLETEATLLARLNAAPADVLLVAMGNPKQEEWIARCITPAHAHAVMGVGALFDFLSGRIKRAPRIVRAMRLEWFWRLLLEPKRLSQRYLIGFPHFLGHVLIQKLSNLK